MDGVVVTESIDGGQKDPDALFSPPYSPLKAPAIGGHVQYQREKKHLVRAQFCSLFMFKLISLLVMSNYPLRRIHL